MPPSSTTAYMPVVFWKPYHRDVHTSAHRCTLQQLRYHQAQMSSSRKADEKREVQVHRGVLFSQGKVK